jgi:hypothetical protein
MYKNVVGIIIKWITGAKTKELNPGTAKGKQ